MKHPARAGAHPASYARGKATLVMVALAALASADQAAADEFARGADSVEFDIPAQTVPSALSEFARQTQVQLFFISDGFEHVRANTLIGTYSAREGLDLLLEGTGLTGSFSSDSGIEVRPAHAPTVDTAARPASREGSVGGSNDEREAKSVIQEIVVTGTHIRGVDTVGAAVITFSREELEQSGFASVEEFFENLPQNLDELSSDGSLATGVSRVAGTNNQGASSVSLRGLGPGSTLVLLNGKRRPANVFGLAVDISAIPLSMIERIDIVTNGRSAVYGSDAVAGVVNIVTRKEIDGGETRISYGEASAGAGQFELSQTFGHTLGRGSFTLGYTYREDRPLDATDAGVVIAPSRVGATPLPGLFDLRHASEQHSGLLAARIEMGDHAELYADAHLSLDTNTREIAFGLLGIEIGEISVTDSDQYSAAAGLKMDLGSKWRLDVSALAGAVENTRASTSLVLPAGSITTLDVPLERARNDEAGLASASAIADGPIAELGGRTVLAATGVEFRTESYERVQADLATGAVVPFQDIDRDIWAVFGEVRLPLLERNGRRLDVSLAARYESYSDFGDTLNPQLGVEWRPADGLTLRGAYSESFRAPNLATLALGTQVGADFLNDPLTGTMLPVFSEFGGNPDLQPEEADTWTVGVDWQPSERTTVSLSYFSIEYEGRIDQPASSAFRALEDASLYPGLIDRNPTQDEIRAVLDRLPDSDEFLNSTGIPFDPETDDPFAVFPGLVYFDNRRNNIGLESVDGFDVNAFKLLETGLGEFSLGVRGTYYLNLERKITAEAPTIETLNRPGKPVDLKLRAHLGWEGSVWALNTYLNYVDSYTDTFAVVPKEIDSWTTIDLSLRFTAPQGVENGWLAGTNVTLGINNLLDERPPVFSSDLRGLGYDAANADATGRFVLLRVCKPW